LKGVLAALKVDINPVSQISLEALNKTITSVVRGEGKI
jgi:hypothetical protein